MKVGEIYTLRMALVNAGYITVPCRDRKPVITLRSAPSEGFVRSWATVHPEADQTGIVVGDHVVVVADLAEARTAAAAMAQPATAIVPAKEEEIPHGAKTMPKTSPGQDASRFLVDYLAGAPKPSRSVIEAARAQGISGITLRRAKLGIVKSR